MGADRAAAIHEAINTATERLSGLNNWPLVCANQCHPKTRKTKLANDTSQCSDLQYQAKTGLGKPRDEAA